MTIQTLIKTLSDAKFDVHSGVAPDGTACPYLVLDDIEQLRSHPGLEGCSQWYSAPLQRGI